MVIKVKGKKFEKASRALGDIQNQQYQKDAHKCEDTQGNENVDKGEYAVLTMTEKKSSMIFEPIQYYMLFTSQEVRIGKNCARGLGYRPRPQDRGHSFSQYGPT